MSCIYKITNNINKKIYIGLTTKTAELRFKQHVSGLNSKKNKNCFLNRAFHKYGVENFSFSTLIEGDYNIEQLSKLEINYIKKYNSYAIYKKGYNLTTGGIGPCSKIISNETKLKMSIAQKTKSYRPSKETIAKRIESSRWYKQSLETRNKRIVSLKNFVKTEEHSQKIKDKMSELYKNGFNPRQNTFCYIYDTEDNLLHKFKSITETIKRLNISYYMIKNSRQIIEKNNKIRIIISKYEY